MTRAKQATLKDVAARAQVDPSLVSRLVNNDARLSISEPTRKRVLDAIEEVGYRPNRTAKALRLGRTYLVGLQVPDFTNPIYSELIQGAREAADDAGYILLVGSASAAPEDHRWFDKLLDDSIVDGMLFASGVLEDPRLEEIAARDERILIVNRLMSGGAPAVVLDDVAGSRIATRHLIELGHRRIGAVAGPPRVETTERRRRGFLEEAAQAGIDSPPVILASTVSADAGYAAASMLLQEQPDLSAIFATTTMIAFGVLKAVIASGRGVPHDISLVVLNDSELARYVEPALTTVALPHRELGRVAIQQLLRRLDGAGDATAIMVNDPPPRLIVRDSTAPPRAQ